jgi:hypothetical protein
LEVQNNVGANYGVNFNGVNKKIPIRSSNLEIMFCGFPREKIHT